METTEKEQPTMIETPQRPAMPPKVAAAVAAVMSDVPKLAKGEKNEHGRYSFASIDDFLEAVRPLCAKHGLIIMQDEESFEMIAAGKDRNGNDRNWLSLRFSYTLAHTSGETWAHRPVRSIMVDASMGSQAFGAAQSYSLKQFERSLFQIATGEKDADADSHPPADLPANHRARKAAPATPPKDSRDPFWTGPLTKTDLQNNLKALFDRLDNDCDTPEELQALLDEYAAVLQQADKDTPGWMTGERMPPEFVPGNKRIMNAKNRVAEQTRAA